MRWTSRYGSSALRDSIWVWSAGMEGELKRKIKTLDGLRYGDIILEQPVAEGQKHRLLTFAAQ